MSAPDSSPRSALRFLGNPARARRGPESGAAPGTIVVPEDSPAPTMRVMVYSSDELVERTCEDPAELPALIDPPETVAWIDVEGFGDRERLEQIAEILGIHPLAMADVVHVPQRPKVEAYDDRLLVITQMARVTPSRAIDLEQLALVLGRGWVVSFQERTGDVFDPVRARIRTPTARIRRMGADFLLYALLDAVIDGYFPVVEALAGVIDALEEEVVEDPSAGSLARIHATRRTLLTLHRVQWRQRDAVNALLRDETLPLSDEVRPYLRDVHDHAFQTLDVLETCRDLVVSLMDLHLSSASHRMNEVMKTLTIVATVFIPLTFLVGVYGMNFEHMPELGWRWGYALVWGLMVAVGAGLVFWFRHRGWLGGS